MADINLLLENSLCFIKLTKGNKNDIMENESYYDIVAITTCPVGIAHTYISAEKLEKAAKEKNLKIKIQTNGSIGIKNELSQQDIKNAKAVILAIDIDIDESMFNGKFVTKVPVAYAINKTNDLIDKALKNNTTYELKNLSNSTPSGMKNGFSGYKHLLNEVSFMIPFIVVGGVFNCNCIFWSWSSNNYGPNSCCNLYSTLNNGIGNYYEP